MRIKFCDLEVEDDNPGNALDYFKINHVSDLITMTSVPVKYCLNKEDVIKLLEDKKDKVQESIKELEEKFAKLV